MCLKQRVVVATRVKGKRYELIIDDDVSFLDATNKVSAKTVEKGIGDILLGERCENATRRWLEAGMYINKVCMFIKDYCTKCLFIRQEGGDYKAFTLEMWWELGQTGTGSFKTALQKVEPVSLNDMEIIRKSLNLNQWKRYDY